MVEPVRVSQSNEIRLIAGNTFLRGSPLLRVSSGGPISAAISLSESTKYAGPWPASAFLNTGSVKTPAGSLKRFPEKLKLKKT